LDGFIDFFKKLNNIIYIFLFVYYGKNIETLEFVIILLTDSVLITLITPICTKVTRERDDYVHLKVF